MRAALSRSFAVVTAAALAGLLATVAGCGEGETGAAGPAPGGTAQESRLAEPDGLALDDKGNLYVSERAGHRVDQIAPDGTMFSVAGKGSAGFSGDGTNGNSAQLQGPTGLIAPMNGSLTIADTGNDRVRLMGSDGFIETMRGAAPPQLDRPVGVALDGDGNLVVADSRHGRVVRIEPDGLLQVVAAGLGRPTYLVLDGDDVIVADAGGDRVVRIDAAGAVTSLAGAEEGLLAPTGVAFGRHGALLVSDTGHNRVVEIEDDGTVTVVAGTGAPGLAGDGGKAVDARLRTPAGLAVDGAGNIYVADQGNDRVRRIDREGVIETVAGGG